MMVITDGPFAGLEFGVVDEPNLTRTVSLGATEVVYVESARNGTEVEVMMDGA